MDKPYYPCDSIGSVEVLAKTLGLHPKHLISIADKAEESYTTFLLPPNKKTGKEREVREAKFELKRIQKRINSRIFEHVIFPEYLQGGLKATLVQGRDYVENASIHSRCHTLINLDVRNFYPNIKSSSVRDVFKQFFRFSDEVVDLLVKLTTYRGSIPQGGCTSSYLANLVFFNNEYHLVSKLRGQGLTYSRLLDDITISSVKRLTKDTSTEVIKLVAAMLKKQNLRLNGKKTSVSFRNDLSAKFEVTGLWIKHKQPKIRKQERRYVRQLVYNCELKSNQDKTSDEYHKLWNKTSGLVTKLERLEHSQARSYRQRLSVILPEYSPMQSNRLLRKVSVALRVPVSQHQKLGVVKRYNQIQYQLGILSRTQRNVARKARKALVAHYSTIPTKFEVWER
ncbi:reverse transcriptase family protein [Shewanella aquimarina]|uniref:reverse transcriptase family protein n=1 Tax=Shewanella aquimarina TaxID=260365 RepID=UPI0020148584|nr:reverse transcriptase family protein [Shewanella aquimarina]MCL2910693.1 reverse transcriptase family protein [Shewanella aquimarina]